MEDAIAWIKVDLMFQALQWRQSYKISFNALHVGESCDVDVYFLMWSRNRQYML